MPAGPGYWITCVREQVSRPTSTVLSEMEKQLLVCMSGPDFTTTVSLPQGWFRFPQMLMESTSLSLFICLSQHV